MIMCFFILNMTNMFTHDGIKLREIQPSSKSYHYFFQKVYQMSLEKQDTADQEK